MIRLAVGLFLVCYGFPSAYAAGEDIVFIAATNHTMPLSHFEEGQITGGIIKDLGDSIAKRLGRRAVYISVPPRRVPLYLASGDADSVCYIMPQWIEGSYRWSRPLIPGSGVLVARSDAPVISALPELADKKVGTVLGYRYQNIEAALGSHFAREDAPVMANNMQKLLAGRMQYAVMERMTVDYLLRAGGSPNVRVDMEFEPIKAHCAFSLKSRVKFADADRAINSLLSDGSIERILGQYR
jgi:polar amino acid transport system substrate-binding protein